MSRTKLGIVFLASVSLGSAAAALELGASEAVAVRSVCQCSFCDAVYGCFFAEHYFCGYTSEGICYSRSCSPAQQCL
jgi:hypothetical protein